MEKKKKDYPYIANVNYKSMVYRERDTGSQSLLFLWAVALWIDETRLGSCICSVAFSELEFYMENRRKKKSIKHLGMEKLLPKKLYNGRCYFNHTDYFGYSVHFQLLPQCLAFSFWKWLNIVLFRCSHFLWLVLVTLILLLINKYIPA